MNAFLAGTNFSSFCFWLPKILQAKKEKNWCHFQEAFPYFDTYHGSEKIKKSFILVLLKRKSGIVLQMPIIAILVGGKIVMAW